MTNLLKAMVIASALAAGAFVAGAAPANAQYYHRSGVNVYAGVGARPYYERDRYYNRGYYRDDWRWRRAYVMCHRHWRYGYWRRDCGRHYGWRGSYRNW